MKITIALKKQSKEELLGKLVDAAIKWWTKSKYFHVEMIINNKWISSNPGVGSVYIRDLAPLKENYDYFEIEVDGRKEKKVMRFLESQVSKKYDYWGLIFSTIFTLNIEDRNKWFCSELVSEALKNFGIKLPKNANEMTPEDIYQLIKNLVK